VCCHTIGSAAQITSSSTHDLKQQQQCQHHPLHPHSSSRSRSRAGLIIAAAAGKGFGNPTKTASKGSSKGKRKCPCGSGQSYEVGLSFWGLKGVWARCVWRHFQYQVKFGSLGLHTVRRPMVPGKQ
jgi:hypothetical protein